MIRLVNVRKSFNKHKSNEIRAINDTSIELADTGLVTFLGNSGCGKTTLLNAIGGLDSVNKGDIYINDERITRRLSGKLDEIRNLHIGYIFQNYNLIEDATVFENVALVLRMTGFKDKAAIERRVMYILDRVGIAKYRNRPAKMLSGGERQRVGIARALVKNPQIIIADEPTGNLDSSNTIEVMNIIKAISKQKLVILVTHEREIAEFYADRIVEIVDGKVVDDRENIHDGKLDYRMDSKIFLKDMPVSSEFSEGPFDISFFSDSERPLPKIKIVVRNNNLYIDTEGQLSMGSEGVEIIDDHYQAMTKEVYEKYNFDYNDYFMNAEQKEGIKKSGMPARLKYHSIYGPFSSFGTGIQKIRRYSKIKKILLLGFVLASMFVIYAVSNVAGITHVTDDQFTNMDKNYLTVKTGKLSTATYSKYASLENVNYVLPGNSKVNFAMMFDEYHQATGINVNGSVTDVSKLKKSDIIRGRLPENENEVVIDKLLAVKTVKASNSREVGIKDEKGFVGRILKQPNMPDLLIVGITDKQTPCIYAQKSKLLPIVMHDPGENSVEALENVPYAVEADKIVPFSEYANAPNLKITKGNAPSKDFEVLAPESLAEEVAIGKPINIKVNGSNLVISGFYHDERKGGGLYVNDNTYFMENIKKYKNLTISPINKEATFNQLSENKEVRVVDNYAHDKESHMQSISEGIWKTIAVSAVIVLISLIEIYLMLRASFLSRIKEVGVLRAIGLKKGDIYRMFTGEVLAITLFTALPGMTIMAYFITAITKVSLFASMYRINIYVFGISFLLVLAFNMLAGLLPVFTTLRKTPASILARNDIS
ncbi:MAG: ABC transporter ATP-binding protein/permease [Eubacterium sp.]|nr:ABC transporter ATP-binding protein/permease [Eubacterium sp.]